jgi:pyruvate dehydrogenase complex dehydrogenase (E1) component
MTNFLKTGFVALALVAGAAAPVLASDTFGSFDAARQLQRLHEVGVNATDVAEDTSSTMRATVKLDDGSTAFAYFDVDSLQQVNKSGAAATKVLSKLDVSRTAPVQSLDSLTRDTWSESK